MRDRSAEDQRDQRDPDACPRAAGRRSPRSCVQCLVGPLVELGVLVAQFAVMAGRPLMMRKIATPARITMIERGGAGRQPEEDRSPRRRGAGDASRLRRWRRQPRSRSSSRMCALSLCSAGRSARWRCRSRMLLDRGSAAQSGRLRPDGCERLLDGRERRLSRVQDRVRQRRRAGVLHGDLLADRARDEAEVRLDQLGLRRVLEGVADDRVGDQRDRVASSAVSFV